MTKFNPSKLADLGVQLPKIVVEAFEKHREASAPASPPEVPAVSSLSSDKQIMAAIVAEKRLEIWNKGRTARLLSKERVKETFEKTWRDNAQACAEAVADELNNRLAEPDWHPDAQAEWNYLSDALKLLVQVAVGRINTPVLSVRVDRLSSNTGKVSDLRQAKASANMINPASLYFADAAEELSVSHPPTMQEALATHSVFDVSNIAALVNDVAVDAAIKAATKINQFENVNFDLYAGFEKIINAAVEGRHVWSENANF